LFLAAFTTSAWAQAANSAFHAGRVIADYGPIASVASDLPIPPDTVFKVAFDVASGAKPGEVSRNLESVARFLNMHAEAGVAPSNLQLAVVIHSSATLDMLDDAAYQARKGVPNANAKLVAALLDHGVQLVVCGQSAAGQDVGKVDLLPGVKLALSAMTTHALLQQQGYTLNPF